MDQRILLTGASGFVGARIMACMPCNAAPSLRGMSDDDLRRMIDAAEPDVIIHTAAISDIAACENAPEASRRANVEIPVALARTGVKCVLFSSDQVYGGCASEGPFAEAETAPANLYARQKLEMERRVLDINPESVLLRATWMYDMPIYGLPNRGNFLMSLLLGRLTSFSGTEHRGITYVREVAQHMRRAMALPGGVYNYGSENALTMLQTARWLADALGLSVELREAGPRRSLWMNCDKAKAHGIAFNDTVHGLMQCIEDYGLRP